MTSLHIRNLQTSPDGSRASAEWEVNGRAWKVYYQTHDAPLEARIEGFVAATLLTAMKHGVASISSESPASARFLENLPRVQAFFQAGRPGYHLVDIDIPALAAPRESAGRVGVLFSAGLDSYYTLLKHQDQITDLIYIHGLDIPLSRIAMRQQKSVILRRIAAAFNKRLIEVETNVVGFALHYVPLHMLTSSVLTSVGHQLSGEFRRIYIAAPRSQKDLAFNGSHPDLDYLWGTEALEFIHDGVEAGRIEKAERVAQSEIALQTLHVCLERRQGAYNCGRCEKCLRTMINLRIAAALERCTTFAAPLDLKRVARLKPLHEVSRVYLDENIQRLEESGSDPELLKALLKARQVTWWKKLRRKVERWRFRGAGKRRYQDPAKIIE